jgi:hypothetical protein
MQMCKVFVSIILANRDYFSTLISRSITNCLTNLLYVFTILNFLFFLIFIREKSFHPLGWGDFDTSKNNILLFL